MRHCDVTSAPLRRHYGATATPLRRHCYSLRRHFGATSASLRSHFGATATSLRRHCIVTSASLASLAPLRQYYDVTRRHAHFGVTAASLRSHFAHSTSRVIASLHSHFGVTATSLRRHCDVTTTPPPPFRTSQHRGRQDDPMIFLRGNISKLEINLRFYFRGKSKLDYFCGRFYFCGTTFRNLR